MTRDLVIVLGVAVTYFLAVVFLLPYVLAAVCMLRRTKDAGPPPLNGHGWITRKD